MTFQSRIVCITLALLCLFFILSLKFPVQDTVVAASIQPELTSQADEGATDAADEAAKIAEEFGVTQELIDFILADGIPIESIDQDLINDYALEMEATENLEKDLGGKSTESDSMLNAVVPVTTTAPLQNANVVLESCSSQHFPFVFLNIGITDSGLPVTGLNETNFVCTENGAIQTDLFSVTPPETSGNVRLADVVFLIDSSSSMGAEIAAVRQNANAFAQSLAASDVDFRLGLVRFGNSSGPNPFVFNNGNFTSNVAEFEAYVDTLQASGGHEPGFLAIREAIASFNFRTGSQKIFILISDEDSDDPDKQTTIALLLANDITVHTAVACNSGQSNSHYCDETSVRGVTGGQLFDVVGPYDQILNTIVARTASTYIVQYRSSNQAVDGTTRNVHCDVTDANNQPLGSVQCAYVPGAAPIIRLTSETEQLNRTPIPEGSSPTIGAIVTDQAAPFVQAVTLFYRNTGSPSGYTPIPMVSSGNDVYQATIPNVITPGVDYYIRATDGQVTSQLPSSDPALFPFQIAVLPNVAPDISHTPVTSAVGNAPIPLEATVVDTTNRVASVALKWRYVGQLIYETRTMSPGNNDLYQSSLAGGETTADIEYYIEATDDLGLSSRSGTADTPHLITLTLVEPVIFIPGVSGSYLDSAEEELWPAATLNLVERELLHRKLTLDPEKQQTEVTARHAITIANDDLTPPLNQLPLNVVYQPLLDSLTNANYVEYQIDGRVERRTTEGCDLSQASQNPSLFVFAYDWRRDNAQAAQQLADYVGCIRKFYPSSPIHIVAHSMGGMVARRYILDNLQDHGIGKLITMGTPWLGTPQLIYTLETGDFKPQLAASTFAIKDLTEFFPGAHQLLPSQAYFDLVTDVDGELPFVEAGWDYDGNGRGMSRKDIEYYYTAERLHRVLDERYRSNPGTAAEQFHTQDQDDWRFDQSGVEYHVFYGVNKIAKTVGQLTAVVKIVCINLGTLPICYPLNVLDPTMTAGDGLVPVISSHRTSVDGASTLYGPANFYGIDGKAWPQFIPLVTDGSEHLGLAKNDFIHQTILFDILNPQFRIASTSSVLSSSMDTPTIQPARYIDLVGVQDIAVSDSAGNVLDSNNSNLNIPPVTHFRTSEMSHLVIVDTQQPYSITFTAPITPIALSIREGTDTSTTSATQYQDVSMPVGAAALLTIAADGTPLLRFDSNGSGTLDQEVVPSSSVSSGAVDITPPEISINTERAGNQTQVTIDAVDVESGVQAVYYSLDRTNFTPYSEPFTVPTADSTLLYVFADDTLSNRSGLQTFSLTPQFDAYLPVIQNGPNAQTPEPLVPGVGFSTFDVQGPDAGVTNTAYEFNLTLALDPNAGPATIEWSPDPVSGQGTTQATYRWSSAGVKRIDIIATSGRASALTSHYINITEPTPPTTQVPTTPVPTTPVPTTPVPPPTTPVPTTPIPPLNAVNDTATLPEDSVDTPIPVLTNDSGGVGTLRITGASLAANGTVTVDANQVLYTPNANFNGSDSFTYTVSDDAGTSATATVNVTVTPVNDDPVAQPQSVSTQQDMPVTVSLIGSDIDGDALTFSIATSPSNGTLNAITPVNDTSATVQYTPNSGFSGADSFVYGVADGNGGAHTATVTVQVEATLFPSRFRWAIGFGSDRQDTGFGIATNGAGTVHATGGYYGSVDFDPGGGSSPQTSNGDEEAFVARYNNSGGLLAAQSIGGPFRDWGGDVVLDGAGNMYIAGRFRDTVDFDPGPGVANLTAAGEDDVFVLKLSANGDHIWSRAMGGPGIDFSLGTALDPAGNVYVIGYFNNTADFDPGSGVQNRTSNGQDDIFIAKLDSNGSYVWARTFGAQEKDYGRGIVTDASGNVYAVGEFEQTVDFDPGPGEANLTSFGVPDAVVIKLDTNGNYLWARQVGGAQADRARDIAVDSNGNSYITGYFSAVADMNPGSGTVARTAAGELDLFVLKLDSAGTYVWDATVGSSGRDEGYGIGLDGAGGVYTVGYFNGTVDFEPGPETTNRSSNGSDDAFIYKLTTDGGLDWVETLGGGNPDSLLDLHVAGVDQLVAIGIYESNFELLTQTGATNLQPAGEADVLIVALE